MFSLIADSLWETLTAFPFTRLLFPFGTMLAGVAAIIAVQFDDKDRFYSVLDGAMRGCLSIAGISLVISGLVVILIRVAGPFLVPIKMTVVGFLLAFQVLAFLPTWLWWLLLAVLLVRRLETYLVSR